MKFLITSLMLLISFNLIAEDCVDCAKKNTPEVNSVTEKVRAFQKLVEVTVDVYDFLEQQIKENLQVDIEKPFKLKGRSGIVLTHQCEIEVDLQKGILRYTDSRSSITPASFDLNLFKKKGAKIENISGVDEVTYKEKRGVVLKDQAIMLRQYGENPKRVEMVMSKSKTVGFFPTITRRVCNFEIE